MGVHGGSAGGDSPLAAAAAGGTPPAGGAVAPTPAANAAARCSGPGACSRGSLAQCCCGLLLRLAVGLTEPARLRGRSTPPASTLTPSPGAEGVCIPTSSSSPGHGAPQLRSRRSPCRPSAQCASVAADEPSLCDAPTKRRAASVGTRRCYQQVHLATAARPQANRPASGAAAATQARTMLRPGCKSRRPVVVNILLGRQLTKHTQRVSVAAARRPSGRIAAGRHAGDGLNRALRSKAAIW